MHRLDPLYCFIQKFAPIWHGGRARHRFCPSHRAGWYLANPAERRARSFGNKAGKWTRLVAGSDAKKL